jgi:hypothetical protein
MAARRHARVNDAKVRYRLALPEDCLGSFDVVMSLEVVWSIALRYEPSVRLSVPMSRMPLGQARCANACRNASKSPAQNMLEHDTARSRDLETISPKAVIELRGRDELAPLTRAPRQPAPPADDALEHKQRSWHELGPVRSNGFRCPNISGVEVFGGGRQRLSVRSSSYGSRRTHCS